MVHNLSPDLLRRPVRVLVVGCGGNGSAITAGLPYLHQAMLVHGHRGGLDVTLMDWRCRLGNELRAPTLQRWPRDRTQEGRCSCVSRCEPLTGA